MSKKLIINKGYTVTAKSWENDGDHNKTSTSTYATKEMAVSLARMCRDLCGETHTSTSVANECCEHGDRDWYKCCEIVVDYFKNNSSSLIDTENLKDEDIVDRFQDISGGLLGWSEYYFARVCESVDITYSAEDVYLETIDF